MRKCWQGVARWCLSATGQRVVMGVCLAVQVWCMVVLHEVGAWAWWLAFVSLVVLAALQVRLEVSRRGWAAQAKAWRWQIAETTGDPVAAMAYMAYLDTLTEQQVQEITAWFDAHPVEEFDADTAPPLVVEALGVLLHPPREGGHG